MKKLTVTEPSPGWFTREEMTCWGSKPLCSQRQSPIHYQWNRVCIFSPPSLPLVSSFGRAFLMFVHVNNLWSPQSVSDTLSPPIPPPPPPPRFHRELTRGAAPDWTITNVWHWHWKQAEWFDRRFRKIGHFSHQTNYTLNCLSIKDNIQLSKTLWTRTGTADTATDHWITK